MTHSLKLVRQHNVLRNLGKRQYQRPRGRFQTNEGAVWKGWEGECSEGGHWGVRLQYGKIPYVSALDPTHPCRTHNQVSSTHRYHTPAFTSWWFIPNRVEPHRQASRIPRLRQTLLLATTSNPSPRSRNIQVLQWHHSRGRFLFLSRLLRLNWPCSGLEKTVMKKSPFRRAWGTSTIPDGYSVGKFLSRLHSVFFAKAPFQTYLWAPSTLPQGVAFDISDAVKM